VGLVNFAVRAVMLRVGWTSIVLVWEVKPPMPLALGREERKGLTTRLPNDREVSVGVDGVVVACWRALVKRDWRRGVDLRSVVNTMCWQKQLWWGQKGESEEGSKRGRKGNNVSP